jgi:hypothetical protein
MPAALNPNAFGVRKRHPTTILADHFNQNNSLANKKKGYADEWPSA